MTIRDISSNSCSNLRKIQIHEKVCVFVLQKLKATNPDASKCTNEIWEYYQQLRKQHKKIVKLEKNTNAQYLSILAKSQESPIACEGRRQGYYLRQEPQECNQHKIDSSEKSLYPIVLDWLVLNSYQYVADISTKKKMGEWGNPDVLGVEAIEFLGEKYFNVCTIEVKKSLSQWRKLIFESISHTRFANNVYFAFACTEDEAAKTDDMVQYAQKFGIGILAIILTPDNIGFNSKNIKEIRVVAPAPYHNTNIKIQKKFFDTLGITTYDKLMEFHKR